MTAYIIRRLLWMIPILFGVSVICFALLHQAPGDHVSVMMAQARAGGAAITAEERQRLRVQYGLDRPVYLQYVDWLGQVAQGNFGISSRTNAPVTEVIMGRLPNTLKLMLAGLTLPLIIALPLGILSAVKQYSRLDYFLTSFNFIGISIPQFWLALMLLYFFGVTLGWFPTRGMGSPYSEPGLWNSITEVFRHYTLPVISVTLVSLAGYMRYQRAAMLEVIRQDYIRTARAKGLSEAVVILKHAWRNALIPILTLLGYVLVILIEGSIVVEVIFSWPGMGDLAVTSLQQRDYPVVMGIVLLSAVGILVGTLISDILYAVVDPRVRYD
jgi:peptide/nickel transport system permease protein